MTQDTSQPVPQSKRLETLDILRGFALLGILLANTGNYSLYQMQPSGIKARFPYTKINEFLDAFHYGFIDGKFYAIFSLLFGIGFSLIFFQKESGGRLSLFYRRLFFLLIIGLVHALLIWEGDILVFYALVGALLPLFRNMAPRKLILVAGLLMISPMLFDGIKVATSGRFTPGKTFETLAFANDDQSGITGKNYYRWVLDNDSYANLTQWNRSGFYYLWYLRIESNRIPKVLAMFILGLAVGKLRIFERFDEYRRRLFKLMIGGLIIGIPAALARIYLENDKTRLPDPGGLLDTFAYLINVVSLSLAYSIAIVLIYHRYKPKLLRWLQPVGRMALTNYIMQSVISVGIYYGIGLGMGAQFGPAIYMPIAFGIFILQIIYSKIWLSYFNFGPAEWVWRQLTYRKRLKLRKVAV